MTKAELYTLIENTQPNICQIAAYRGGEKAYSAEWNGYKPDDCTHVMSATKSIVALLIGIAIDQGLIKSIDDKVLGYFPDYSVKRGGKTIYDVSIKHLLTMRAPYKCKGDPWTKVCGSEDWTKASLDFLGGRKGLTGAFCYQTVCLHVLTGLLYQVSKMQTVDFANKYLFVPIGAKMHTNYYAQTAEEHKHFTMCKEPKENAWFCDPTKIGTAGYGLCLSADDMAKIGLLCLNKGVCNGRRIVSAQWLADMTAPVLVESDRFRNMMYGYLWWIIDKEKNIYAAIGNSGNVIYVDPTNDVVIAVSSHFKPTVFDRVDFIEQAVKPFVLSI